MVKQKIRSNRSVGSQLDKFDRLLMEIDLKSARARVRTTMVLSLQMVANGGRE